MSDGESDGDIPQQNYHLQRTIFDDCSKVQFPTIDDYNKEIEA